MVQKIVTFFVGMLGIYLHIKKLFEKYINKNKKIPKNIFGHHFMDGYNREYFSYGFNEQIKVVWKITQSKRSGYKCLEANDV